MHYRAIKTLFPAFFIWQSLSMSQFTLKRKTYAPKLHKNHNILACLSLLIQLIALLHGVFYPELYLDTTLPIVLICMSVGSLSLIRFLSILIVIESHLHRKDEIKFLTLISKSDEILINKLQIDIKYKEQRQNSVQKQFIRIFLFLILIASFIFDWIVIKVSIQATVWFALLSFPIFTCSMRYLQIICYVNLIHDRYKLLNEYIEKIDISIELAYKNSVQSWKEKSSETAMIMNKLKNVLEIQSYLLDARCIINNSFKWSLLFNLVNDFQWTLGSAYFLIFSIIIKGVNIEIMSGTIWVVQGLFNFASLANACLAAKEEVCALKFKILHIKDSHEIYHRFEGQKASGFIAQH